VAHAKLRDAARTLRARVLAASRCTALRAHRAARWLASPAVAKISAELKMAKEISNVVAAMAKVAERNIKLAAMAA